MAANECRILNMPEELIEPIARRQDLADLNAFCRSCPRLHYLFFGDLCRLYECTPNRDGHSTCIDWAIFSGNGRLETVDRAIEYGGVVPHFHRLVNASARGYVHVVRRLLQIPHVVQEWKHSFALDDLESSYVHSPLAAAVKGSHEDIVEVLAVPDFVDAAMQVTAFSSEHNIMPAICVAAREENVKIVRQLLDCGADIDSRDSDGSTPLQRAAKFGASELFVELVHRGADMYQTDRHGDPMLNIAARHNAPMVQALLDNGHPLNNYASTHGRGPLTDAAIHNRCDVVNLLVSRGAIFKTDGSGQTPLMVAAHHGSTEVVQTLLSLNVDVDAKDDKGKTALFRALDTDDTIASKSAQICEILLEAGADLISSVRMATPPWLNCVAALTLPIRAPSGPKSSALWLDSGHET